MTAPDFDVAASEDWDGRALCSDENCIGVLGPDAKCNLCGKLGELPAGGVRACASPDRSADRFAAGDAERFDSAFTAGDRANSADDGEFENRELCPDGNCIGVLDSAGVCKVCGKNQGSQTA